MDNLNPIIDLAPDTDSIDANFEKYVQQESQFPAAPAKSQGLRKLLVIVILIVTGIPALLLTILRIPFQIIRRIRLVLLKQRAARIFHENYDDDPDNWREFVFEEPPRKLTQRDKRLEKSQNALSKRRIENQDKLDEEPNNLNHLMDYIVLENPMGGRESAKKALFLLNEMKELPEQEDLKYDVLYQNLSVMCFQLQLINQAKHYADLAKEKGYVPPEHDGKLDKLALFMLITAAWNSLYRDIINCWPKPVS